MTKIFWGALSLALVSIATASGAYSAPVDESYTGVPEMITRVRSFTDDNGKIPQVLNHPDSVWEKQIKVAENAYKSGCFGDADRALQVALKEAQKVTPPDKKLAATYCDFGILFQARGMFAKAEPYYERSVREMGKVVKLEEAELLIALSRLGQFYFVENKPLKAQPVYNKLVQLIDAKLKQEQNVFKRLDDLSGFYKTYKGYPQASHLVSQLQDITKSGFATQHLELAASLDSFAAAFKSRGKLPECETLYKYALDLRQRSLCSDHMALAKSYSNLANLYAVQKRFAQAEPLFKKAQEITGKRNEPGKAANNVSDLAGCLEGQAKLSEAETLYQKALTDVEKNHGGSHPAVAKSLLSLAAIYQKEGKYSEAEPLLKRALTINESLNGPQHHTLIPVLENYAEVLRKNNKSSEADLLVARARALKGM